MAYLLAQMWVHDTDLFLCVICNGVHSSAVPQSPDDAALSDSADTVDYAAEAPPLITDNVSQ